MSTVTPKLFVAEMKPLIFAVTTDILDSFHIISATNLTLPQKSRMTHNQNPIFFNVMLRELLKYIILK